MEQIVWNVVIAIFTNTEIVLILHNWYNEHSGGDTYGFSYHAVTCILQLSKAFPSSVLAMKTGHEIARSFIFAKIAKGVKYLI